MFLGIITLLTALCISGIAAFYSITGLAAIFAAATIPVIIMGSILEIAKIVGCIWLHYNWERSPWKIKSYLVFAVGTLMIITSLGIFGFLSRAHIEQAVPSSDIQAQVALFDEKIKTQRDNIEANKRALIQLDAAVDQVMARSDTEQGAARSAKLRQTQQKDRKQYQSFIDSAQKEIARLQEERAPIASKLRKVEADVGPIKYLATMIYGNDPDQNLLESAVRWVIILIVFVFDPLAVVLILAATVSIDWSRRKTPIPEIKEKSYIDALTDNTKIVELINIINTLEYEIIDLLSRNEALEIDIAKLKDQTPQRVINEIENQNKEEINEQNDNTTQISEFENMKNELFDNQHRLKTLQLQYNSLVEQRNNEEQIKNELLENQLKLEKLQTQYNTLVEQSNVVEIKHAELLEELEYKKHEVETLQNQYDTLVEQRNNEINKFEQQLINNNDELIKLQTERHLLLPLENENINLKTANEKLINDFTETQSNYEEAKTNYQTIINTLNSEITLLQNKADEVQATYTEKLKEVTERHEQIINTLQNELLRVSTEKDQAINQLTQANKDQELTLNKLQNETNAELTHRIEQLTKVNQDQSNLISLLQVKFPEIISEKDNEIATLKEEVRNNEVYKQNVNEIIINAEKMKNESDIEITQLKEIINKVETENVALKRDLVGVQQALTSEPTVNIQTQPKSVGPLVPIRPPSVDLTKLEIITDTLTTSGNVNFGLELPEVATKGDLFLKIDSVPSRLFKWAGSRWIELDKTRNDIYFLNTKYIQWLVEQVRNGRYDVNCLTDNEQNQIKLILERK